MAKKTSHNTRRLVIKVKAFISVKHDVWMITIRRVKLKLITILIHLPNEPFASHTYSWKDRVSLQVPSKSYKNNNLKR